MSNTDQEKFQRVSPEALTEFTTQAICTLGASEDRARSTAVALVGADLRGISSHGVAGGTGLTELIQRTRAEAINIAAIPEVKQQPDMAVASINAKGGLGPAAATEAAQLAGDLAEKYGIGRVQVYDTNHFGAACVYVEDILKRGLAARCGSTSGAWMIPFGGTQVRLGTTPLAWGVPCGDEAIVIDIATSQRAVSPAFRSAKAGEPILKDYFRDKNGTVLDGIISPEQLVGGSVLPLGGEQFGYKGSGLNILIELDNVIGGGSLERIPSMRETPVCRVSHIFEAWRIDTLFPFEETQQRLQEAVRDIRAHGDENMLLPGEREARRKVDSEANGIPYETAQWEVLEKISETTGVVPPKPL